MTRFAQHQASQRLQAERRRIEIIKMIADRIPLAEMAKQLGVCLMTVRRDRDKIMTEMKREGVDLLQQWRAEHIIELEQLRADVEASRVSGKLSMAAIDRMLSILNLDADLKGTKAPSRSISLSLTGALAGLNQDQLEEVARYARTLTESTEQAPDIVVNFVTPKKEQQ